MKSHALPTLAIVILAAGLSVRLGQPKALATVHGRNLLTKTLRVLAPFAARKIQVIVPPAAARYRIGISARSATFTINRQRAAGLSRSVRIGIHQSRYCSAVLLLPVDLVDLTGADIARLIARWRGYRRRVAARRIGTGAGTPLILPHWLYPQAANISGAAGLRELMRRLPGPALALIHMPSAESDVDTPEDLAAARRRRHHPRRRAPRARAP